MRIDPPASLPPAIGTIRLATAAAEPPLDPPVERVRSHGLCVAPFSFVATVGVIPNSHDAVRPRTTSPALRSRATSVLSVADT